MIYTDSCKPDVAESLNEQGITVIIRDTHLWDIPEVMKHLCDQNLKYLVINTLDETGISEITLASLFSKKIIVTDKLIETYDYPIKKLVDYVLPQCNLNNTNNIFYEWYDKQ